MTRAELGTALEWAAAEGWNPGLGDADAFHATDPDGFVMGFQDDAPVGCISVVRYPEAFAFLGLYIVRPELRGRGHGMTLWRAGMDRLHGCRVGLDGVVAQQANYRRSGFVLAHRNVRYAGSGRIEPPDDPDLVPLDRVPFAALAAYDRPLFPAARETFLTAWLRPPHSGVAVLRDGALCGYGVVRPCRQGAKIGPLMADDTGTAELLFRALAALAALADGPFHLDVPEPNDDARTLAERHGMTPVFETARMYVGGDPVLPLHRIYGITTFELG